MPSQPGPGRAEPSLWEEMAVDPSIPIDRDTLRLVIEDQRRSESHADPRDSRAP